MDYRRFGNQYVLRIDRGEELMEKLTEFCEKEALRLGAVSGLGAADYMEVGLYSVEEKQYHGREFFGEMEITSLTGSITEKEGKPYLHLHVNTCDKNMDVHGGHLRSLRISATAEIIVTKIEGTVGREIDWFSDTGLNLFQFQ